MIIIIYAWLSVKLSVWLVYPWPLDRWVLDSVLIDQPLIDASLMQHDGKWWMFASNRRQKTSKNCREMEIW